jgi:L-serine dehydratase
MEKISVFDIFKIGVGPSSSHTMGPWRAARFFIGDLPNGEITELKIDLYGSLSKTGKGHGTDVAVQLGLMDHDPVTIDTQKIDQYLQDIREKRVIQVNGQDVAFQPALDIVFHGYNLPAHPNAMTVSCQVDGKQVAKTYYSVGGGFIKEEGEDESEELTEGVLPYPIQNELDLIRHIETTDLFLQDVVMENEKFWRSEDEVRSGLLNIWQTMKESIYRGCYAEGILPGGLNVVRRAAKLNRELLGNEAIDSLMDWYAAVKVADQDFSSVTKWVSCFALAVNEENASFGRVVTAPTNGAAGVIPAVLMYHMCFNSNKGEEDIIKFLLTAGEIGSLFKKGSTISAAMGGCQAEIGVSSAMAAAGLTKCLGGSCRQVLMAAEIAMEHHMGLTCDPVGGLVQVPCIERNTMGAMKAITASQIALTGNPELAKVSLDSIIKTMKETAQDMNDKYKETSEGGLAVNVSVVVPEC